MARKLKVYRTSIGFFELAVAAPSMKAAAEAWGSDPDIFQRGFAEQTDDPRVVDATMAKPGVVLRRPVGSDGEFSENAALPKAPEGKRKPQRPEPAASARKSRREGDDRAKQAAAREEERKQAAAREAERKRQEALERKQQEAERKQREAERERARKQRELLIARADADLEKAQARHDDAVESLTRRRKELEKDEAREDERWKSEQRRHRDALERLER